MKIQTQLNKIADKVSLSGNNFTVNGTVYDLDNLNSAPESLEISEIITAEMIEERQAKRVQFYLDNLVYLEGDEEIIFLKIDVDHQTMFIGNKRKDPEGKEYICSNLMLLYDINNDKDISIDELKIIVDHWNSTESARRAYNINRKNEALKTMTLDEYYLTGKVVS